MSTSMYISEVVHAIYGLYKLIKEQTRTVYILRPTDRSKPHRYSLLSLQMFASTDIDRTTCFSWTDTSDTVLLVTKHESQTNQALHSDLPAVSLSLAVGFIFLLTPFPKLSRLTCGDGCVDILPTIRSNSSKRPNVSPIVFQSYIRGEA